FDSLDWGDVPAWTAAVISVIFGVVSWRSSRKSKAEREQAERATAAAEQHAATAERATQAAERHANAAERSAAVDEKRLGLVQKDADSAERYPWSVQRRGSGDFMLHSRTDTSKYNVDISGDPAAGGENHFDELHGRGPFALDLFITAQSDDTIVVTWHPTPDHTGEAWTQRIDL
ncbi:MAG: hypothetical protein QOG69_107, partial [Actinomycetota bacterium]|nr:hypothetical protein [Actinomycetota bacterium]